MISHPSDLMLWWFSQNLLESSEYETVESHLMECDDCKWDVINFDVVSRAEELDRNGELPDLDKDEVERLLKIFPFAPITKNLSTYQPQNLTGSKKFLENSEIVVRSQSDNDTRRNEEVTCQTNCSPTNTKNKLAG